MKNGMLIQIEASGIQEYIFGCNHLQQNIGASELVSLSTTLWIADVLDQMQLQHNARWDMSTGQLKVLQSGDYQAEVIYASSGAALLWIEGEPDGLAKGFVKRLTRRVLKEARGLSLLVESIPLDWEKDALSQKHSELRRQAARRKLNRTVGMPLPGLAVTAACDYTGQPVVGRDPQGGSLISKTVQCKLAKMATGNEHLHRVLPQVRQQGMDFIYDFDQIGQRGESSYLAVVHLDGNSMGSRFKDIADAHPAPQDNQAYVEQLRAFSQAVVAHSMQALTAVVDEIIFNLKDGKIADVVPTAEKEGSLLLPFRPIVFGGDDVTFVCEGRLGLPLAAQFLDVIAQGALPGARKDESGDPLYARAGVAIVKNHYPFSRAYELAGELCQSAKKELDAITPQGKGCVLDWQIAKTGLVLDLSQIRVREYSALDGASMLMRPVRVDVSGEEVSVESKYWRSWQNFRNAVETFRDDGNWAEHRNKVIDLQGRLRHGPKAVKQFLSEYGQPTLPPVAGKATMADAGWVGEECGYADALEALDYYVQLQEGGSRDE